MTDIVDFFFFCTGWNDNRGYYAKICKVIFTYGSLSISLFFVGFTCLSVIFSTTDLSTRIYGFLWFFVGIHIIGVTVIRIYFQSQSYDMYLRSEETGIPENYRWAIGLLIQYYFITGTVYVIVPLLYTMSFESVQMGDLFTFPYVDVFPIKTANLTIYLCKYIFYAFPVYCTNLEGCSINATILYFTGALKSRFEVLKKQVEEAAINKDEQKLKIAIKHHQELLKYFKEIETIYEYRILMSIEFSGIYVGITGFIIIQIMQGNIHPLVLALCLGSAMGSLAATSVFCFSGSVMNDLHDSILISLFEHRLCYSPNKSLKQLIVLMMTRTALPLELKAGSIFTLNLNLLVKILKFTYSVFNLLLTSLSYRIK